MAKGPIHPGLPIFDGRQYTAIPTFFVDDLMRIGKGIPPSFWKLTDVILRKVLAPTRKVNDEWVRDYVCKTTEKQLRAEYNIPWSAVADWTRSYSASGLFTIQKGSRHVKDVKGIPTIWHYRKEATFSDWVAFIAALSEICCGPKMVRRGKNDQVDSSKAFLLKVALAVDRHRSVNGGTVGPSLPPVNTKLIERLLARGVGQLMPDGSINFKVMRPAKPFKETKGVGDPMPDWREYGD
jgi:hypothetical protein